MDLKDFIQDDAPPWMRTGQGDALLWGLGDQMDALIQRNKDAVASRFPSYSPPDGLAAIGVDRQLPRGTTDTDETFADRLRSAWDIWQWAGTPFGLLTALDTAGYSNVHLLTKAGSIHRLVSGAVVTTSVVGGFSWSPDFWNTFKVFFAAPLPAAWSGTPPLESSPEALNIKSLIRRWKPAHALLVNIIIETGPVWGYPTTLTWGQAALTWGGATPATVWGP